MSIEVNDDTSPTFSAGSYCPSLKSNPYLMYFIDTFSLQRCLLYDSPGGKLYHIDLLDYLHSEDTMRRG